jgi:hypothetical protein
MCGKIADVRKNFGLPKLARQHQSPDLSGSYYQLLSFAYYQCTVSLAIAFSFYSDAVRPPEALLRWRLKARNADAVGKRKYHLLMYSDFTRIAVSTPEAPTLLEAKIR